MKRNINYFRFATCIFIISLIIVLFIVYKDIDSSIAFKFVVGFVIYTLLYIIFMIFTTIIKTRKLESFDRNKRIGRFMFLFIILTLVYYMGNFIFIKESNIDLLRITTISLSTAFGISYGDVLFAKNK